MRWAAALCLFCAVVLAKQGGAADHDISQDIQACHADPRSAACMLESGRQRLVSLVYIVDYGLPRCPAKPVLRTAKTDVFAWHAQKAVIDFSLEDSGRTLVELIEDASAKTILYIDWTMRNAGKSELFGRASEEGSTDAGVDQETCPDIERYATRPGGVVLSGRPDANNNHLLLRMTVDTGRGAPFARARCEYADSLTALRLRGFFYVTNIGTATARQLEFQPVAIPAHRVPASFLEHLK